MTIVSNQLLVNFEFVQFLSDGGTSQVPEHDVRNDNADSIDDYSVTFLTQASILTCSLTVKDAERQVSLAVCKLSKMSVRAVFSGAL